MKVFEVSCPTMVNLYLNKSKMSGLGEKLLMINDTIDICDKVSISVSSKNTVSRVYLNGVLTIEDNLLKKAINAFFDYTNLLYQGVCVKIDKKVPYQLDLNSFDSICAGVILALNMHYHLNLSKKELMEIAKGVSSIIPYYVRGGYQKIYDGDKIIYQNCKGIYDNYLIALGNGRDNWSENLVLNDFSSNVFYNNQFYNCLETMAPNELLDLKNKLLELKADKVCVNGTSNSVVAYFHDYHERFRAKEELKGQKVKCLVVKPSDGIKIMTRYI